VVVSAMGDSTDRLLSLASRVAKDPAARELDQLLSTGEGVSAPLMSMALNELGVPAVSLLGFQAGIQTNRRHARARIVGLTPARIPTRSADPDMLELASSGARVMHPRAVEIAEAYTMELHVRSSFHAGPGTIICSEEAIMEDRNRVRGIAHEEHVARLSVVGVP